MPHNLSAQLAPKRPDEKVLNPTVVKLGMVSLFADISGEMLYPITPIFLTTVLGASMASVGFIEGLAEAIASLLKTFSGLWSDRIARRKPFVVVGYLLAAVAKPVIGLAATWPMVLFARGLDRTGKGLRTAPRDALLAESVAPELRGSAFGWHRGMDTLGAAIGPLIAIFYLSLDSVGLRAIFFWALIPGLASVAIALAVPERPHAIPSPAANWIECLSWNSFSPSFKTYLGAWGAFSIANSSDVFLLMRARQAGLPLQMVILLYCFYNLVYSLMSPWLGGLSDRVGRKKILLAGFGIFAAVYLGFSFIGDTWHFWILFGIYGLYMAATDGVGKALVLDLVGPATKATGLGVFGTLTGFATIFASTVAGIIWESLGPAWTFVYGAAGAVLAGIILAGVHEQKGMA